MTRRQLLVRAAATLSLVAAIAIAVPFVGSMAPRASAIVEVDFPELKVGVPVRIDVDGSPLLLLLPNDNQLASIAALESHVVDKDYVTFRPEIGAFVYWAIGTRRENCGFLEEQPPQPSRLGDWNNDAKWLGGYWDPVCEVSFDYAGRAIKTYEYSYIGFVGDYPPLETPLVLKKSGGKLQVSRYGKQRLLTAKEG